MKCTLGYLTELKKEYPYTVYQPSREVINQLEVGHIVKLLFFYDIPNQQYGGERMWVKITNIDKETDSFEGVLDNIPLEAPINMGDKVCFKTENIYDTELFDLEAEKLDYYFDNLALVSEDVFDKGEFNFMCKSEPNNERDTGWVVYSGYEPPNYEMNSDNFRIISIGYLFNLDDSIKEFFDVDIFKVYERNEKGLFEEVKDYDWSYYKGEE